jgi:hypothetical protein
MKRRQIFIILFLILLFQPPRSVSSCSALKSIEEISGPVYAILLIGSSRYRSPGNNVLYTVTKYPMLPLAVLLIEL